MYNCPDCQMILKDCGNCARTSTYERTSRVVRHPCDGCPNKPLPGETKVCYCTLGTPKLTCNTETYQTSQGPDNSGKQTPPSYLYNDDTVGGYGPNHCC